MLRTTLSVLAMTVAAPAFAGGVVHAPAPPPVVPVLADDWTEFYIGGQIDLIASGEVTAPGAAADELEGHLIGAFAGYRYDLGDFTIGAEVDYMVGTVDLIPSVQGLAPIELDTTVIRAGLEAGYDLGDLLVYGTVGFANLEAELENSTDVLESNGYFAGVGLDYRVSESIVVGAEILYHEFSDFDGGADLTIDITTVGVNVAFTF